MKFGMRPCAPGKRATLLTVSARQISSRNRCLLSDMAATSLLSGTGLLLVVNLLAHLSPGLTRLVYRDLIFDGANIARIVIENHCLEHPTHDLAAPRLGKHADKMHLADHGQRA